MIVTAAAAQCMYFNAANAGSHTSGLLPPNYSLKYPPRLEHSFRVSPCGLPSTADNVNGYCRSRDSTGVRSHGEVIMVADKSLGLEVAVDGGRWKLGSSGVSEAVNVNRQDPSPQFLFSTTHDPPLPTSSSPDSYSTSSGPE